MPREKGPPELTRVEDLEPAAYNPRTVDPDRLALVALSLRKLGFLLPIYATEAGEVLSGHQRLTAARTLGATHVPVVRLTHRALRDRQALNILFNRATNDIPSRRTGSRDLTARIDPAALQALADRHPNIPTTSQEWAPCLHVREADPPTILRRNMDALSDHALGAARQLWGRGVRMPAVITDDWRVVNGIGRLQAAAERDEPWPVVVIPAARADLAGALLNSLTMDFDLTRFADVLRFNSFRRTIMGKAILGSGHAWLLGDAYSAKPALADLTDPAIRGRWVSIHGTRVVDFGAGTLTATRLMRAAGVQVTPFEPYRLTPGTMDLDIELSRATTREFLEAVARGDSWDTVFINAVLNSVPFRPDREHVVTVAHALTGPDTLLVASALSTLASFWQHAYRDGISRPNKTSFVADYEPGVVLAELTHRPKMQKVHTVTEFRSLFDPLFGEVDCKRRGTRVAAVCRAPRPVDPERLAAAIRFEFDLPYPDGERLVMVAEALEAFGERHKIPLPNA